MRRDACSAEKKTHRTRLNVKLPGENVTAAPQEFVSCSQVGRKGIHINMSLGNVSLSLSTEHFEITRMGDVISIDFHCVINYGLTFINTE